MLGAFSTPILKIDYINMRIFMTELRKGRNSAYTLLLVVKNVESLNKKSIIYFVAHNKSFAVQQWSLCPTSLMQYNAIQFVSLMVAKSPLE